MIASPYTSQQMAHTIARVVGELDAKNPRLVSPAEIVVALQARGILPVELPAGHCHEAGVLSWFSLVKGYLSDSKCRTYRVRKKTVGAEQMLKISFD